MKPARSFACLSMAFVVLLTSCSVLHPESKKPDVQLHAEVAELLKHLNEKPDVMLNEMTEPIWRLIQLGRPALKNGALELLLSDDRETRYHAQMILGGIVEIEMGARNFDRSYEERKKAQEDYWKLWKTNGDYDYDAPPELRQAAYEKWLIWLQTTNAPVN